MKAAASQPMATKPVAEFMRYTAPDAQAHARGIEELRERLRHALSAGDKLAIVDHAADLGSMLTTDRKEIEALQLLREHAAEAEALPHQEAAGWFWNAYATALQYTGQRSEADAYFAKALSLCDASGWSRLKAFVLHHWGRSFAEQQRFMEAEGCIGEALSLRIQLDDPRQDSSRRALDALAKLRDEKRLRDGPDAESHRVPHPPSLT
jgi:tetratricopeptide (TPR) repeat protein